MNHTPGPWEVRRHANGGITIFSSRQAGSLPIIDVIGDNLPGLRWCGGRDADANARLIAAAPELLEACRAMLEAYAPHTDWSRPDTLHSAVKSAGEAIAKAEGR